jgi:hypothetical protein
MMDNLRGALRSLTMWVNGLAATAVAALPTLRDDFPQIEQYLDHQVYRYAMGALIAANILLRIKTTTSLADKARP